MIMKPNIKGEIMEFTKFKKIPRLSRDITCTEKIDGSNAQLFICPKDNLTAYLYQDENSYISKTFKDQFCVAENDDSLMFAGSRKRWLDCSSQGDNQGFAKWVKDNAEELFKLGDGHHFAEWYGAKIQRRYGLNHRRFALFNVHRWHQVGYNARLVSVNPRTDEEKFTSEAPSCCDVVPILYEGLFDTESIENVLDSLRLTGSRAVPGFMNPEGVVVFHKASGQLFKKLIENDEQPKGRK